MSDNPPIPQCWAHLDELPLQVIARLPNVNGKLLTVVVGRNGTTPALISAEWSSRNIAQRLRTINVLAPNEHMEAIAHWIRSAPVEITDIG